MKTSVFNIIRLKKLYLKDKWFNQTERLILIYIQIILTKNEVKKV